MLFKRGSTISAAEGGCQAEVGGSKIFYPDVSEDLHDLISRLFDGECWLCSLYGRRAQSRLCHCVTLIPVLSFSRNHTTSQ